MNYLYDKHTSPVFYTGMYDTDPEPDLIAVAQITDDLQVVICPFGRLQCSSEVIHDVLPFVLLLCVAAFGMSGLSQS